MTTESPRRSGGRPRSSPQDVADRFRKSTFWPAGPDGPAVWWPKPKHGPSKPPGRNDGLIAFDGKRVRARRVALWLDGRLADLTATTSPGSLNEGVSIAPACDCHLTHSVEGAWVGEPAGFHRPTYSYESMDGHCLNPAHQAFSEYVPWGSTPLPTAEERLPLWSLFWAKMLWSDADHDLYQSWADRFRAGVSGLVRDYGLNSRFAMQWASASTPASGALWFWWWTQIGNNNPQALRRLLTASQIELDGLPYSNGTFFRMNGWPDAPYIIGAPAGLPFGIHQLLPNGGFAPETDGARVRRIWAALNRPGPVDPPTFDTTERPR